MAKEPEGSLLHGFALVDGKIGRSSRRERILTRTLPAVVVRLLGLTVGVSIAGVLARPLFGNEVSEEAWIRFAVLAPLIIALSVFVGLGMAWLLARGSDPTRARDVYLGAIEGSRYQNGLFFYVTGCVFFSLVLVFAGVGLHYKPTDASHGKDSSCPSSVTVQNGVVESNGQHLKVVEESGTRIPAVLPGKGK